VKILNFAHPLLSQVLVWVDALGFLSHEWQNSPIVLVLPGLNANASVLLAARALRLLLADCAAAQCGWRSHAAL
jgi:hypothetical protein